MMQIIAKKIGGSLSYDMLPLREYLKKHKDGEEFLIVVERIGEFKSKQTLSYYWKAMIAHLMKNEEQFGGWGKHKIHVWLKEECALGMEVSEMDRKEFGEYIDRCRVRLADEGIYIQTSQEYFNSLRAGSNTKGQKK